MKKPFKIIAGSLLTLVVIYMMFGDEQASSSPSAEPPSSAPNPKTNEVPVEQAEQAPAALPKGVIKDKAFFLPPGYASLKDTQQKGYQQLLAQGKCPILHYADVSQQKGTKADPVIYYMCENDVGELANIFLKVSDIKAGKAQVQPPPSQTWAYEHCREYVKARLNHPSTLRKVNMTTRTWINGRRAVYLDGLAKNSFNLELPIKANCTFIPAGGSKYDMDAQILTEGF